MAVAMENNLDLIWIHCHDKPWELIDAVRLLNYQAKGINNLDENNSQSQTRNNINDKLNQNALASGEVYEALAV